MHKLSACWVYLSKMSGNTRSPLQVNIKDTLTGSIGAAAAIFMLIFLTNRSASNWFMAPFGGSCVLAFAFWNAPFSQPRNIIGGHCISAFIGLAAFHLFGKEPWSIAAAVGLAIAAMMLTKTTHPPAGANPIVIMLGHYSMGYLFSPVLIGSVIIVILALVINNLRQNRKYPTFWF
ncbi:HPP family protein [Paenibacillus sp. JX-17]|uniref:HPP family protein n=1 Tax=Paenibacillus lacisoli TaxID=3064525 RepID=A0ABT9CIC9_9BACL|nr:HPP family protein [Paenibacillus sp. JX-17]MDO7907692.1 HPP family protein [Paenibacillus sp. JX-17]